MTKILTIIGSVDKTNTLVIMSASAHPGPWLAALGLNLRPFVLTEHFSEHSQAHAISLAKMVRKAALRVTPDVSVGVAFEEGSRTIDARVVGTQVVEVYTISQGLLWHDGLNRVIPAAPLAREMTSLVAQELEKHRLAISPIDSKRGRGLVTQAPVREGGVVCPASCLFYDSNDALQSF